MMRTPTGTPTPAPILAASEEDGLEVLLAWGLLTADAVEGATALDVVMLLALEVRESVVVADDLAIDDADADGVVWDVAAATDVTCGAVELSVIPIIVKGEVPAEKETV